MAYYPGEMEITDRSGTTDSFTGLVTTSPISIPSTPGNHIDELSIRCTVDQPSATRLEFSIDGGSNWHRLKVGEAREDEPRGTLTQIKIRAAGVSITSANYEVIINRGQV